MNDNPFLELNEALQGAVAKAGWSAPTDVQKAVLPVMLAGKDVIVQSKTGSGKTGAFLLPIMQSLDPASKKVQALILAPTRELARQSKLEFDKLSEGGLVKAVSVYGGVGYGEQLSAFRSGVHVVIGTPGRVYDHLQRGNLNLDGLKFFILDEADEMLSMGFYEDMLAIGRYLPRKRQSCMFSATIPFFVERLAGQFLTEPESIRLSRDSVHIEDMDHRYYVVDKMTRDRLLIKLIELENPVSSLIFCNTRSEVDFLGEILKRFGYQADILSGDLSQTERDRVMERIKTGKLRFLVATDIAARGIDIKGISHVFMYDFPQDNELYIHRAGRTARAGAFGISITFVDLVEEGKLQKLAKTYNISFTQMELPTDEAVAVRVAERLSVVLETKVRERNKLELEQADRFFPLVKMMADSPDAARPLTSILNELFQATHHALVVDEQKAEAKMEARQAQLNASAAGQTAEPPRYRDSQRGGGGGRPPRHGGGSSGGFRGRDGERRPPRGGRPDFRNEGPRAEGPRHEAPRHASPSHSAGPSASHAQPHREPARDERRHEPREHQRDPGRETRHQATAHRAPAQVHHPKPAPVGQEKKKGGFLKRLFGKKGKGEA